MDIWIDTYQNKSEPKYDLDEAPTPLTTPIWIYDMDEVPPLTTPIMNIWYVWIPPLTMPIMNMIWLLILSFYVKKCKIYGQNTPNFSPNLGQKSYYFTRIFDRIENTKIVSSINLTLFDIETQNWNVISNTKTV